MTDRPVIVTGCGRSGTHLIGHIMAQVFGEGAGAFEPPDHRKIETVVVDSRLRRQIKDIERDGHRIVHLVRDGRDVVRSLHRWYGYPGYEDTEPSAKRANFARLCNEWSEAVSMMEGYPIFRLEDLASKKVRDSNVGHNLPHWREWDDELTHDFWCICGDGMRKMGYEK